MTEREFIEIQAAYFREQEKEACTCLGVELEHFIIDGTTGRSYSYDEPNGQRDLLNKLMGSGWEILTVEEGNPLGLEMDGDTITLEPGGQLEISLRPFPKVAQIVARYRRVLRDICDHLEDNQRIASVGYHPLSKINELPLLPKARYGLMFEHFKGSGTHGHNMMKGTAATQVSIDYTSEEDFIAKFRTANFLSPVLSMIFDGSPVFEGDLYEGKGLRMHIWDHTDPERSKVVPGALDQQFGYEAYAKYILNSPPILITKDDQTIYTGKTRVCDLLHKDFTEVEREHLLGMVFPDVRLKKYIEIRMADALPMPYAMAVPALIKGIFYDKDNLKRYYELSQVFTDQDVKEMNRLVQASGRPCYKGFDLKLMAEQLINDALKVLEADEADYLEELKEILVAYGSVTAYLAAIRKTSNQDFIEAISVGGKHERAK